MPINFIFTLFSLVFYQYPNDIQFIVETNKNTVTEGECLILSASLLFRVGQSSFGLPKNFTTQIGQMQGQLKQEGFFFRESYPNEKTRSKRIEINGKEFISLGLLELAVCPYASGQISIPSLKFSVVELPDKTIELSSRPLTITVTSLSKELKVPIYSNLFYNMIGEFGLFEEIVDQKSTYQLGDTINYRARIYGEGMSFPINLPTSNNPHCQVILRSTQVKDTIVYGKFRTSKDFNIQLIPSVATQSLDLAELFSWKYYSIKEKRIQQLLPQKKITVVSHNGSFIQKKHPHKSINTVFLLDVSESMKLADYWPTRLEKAIDIVNDLLVNDCSATVLAFSGNVVQFEDCRSSIENTDLLGKMKRGTAIGDALWKAIEILESSSINTTKEIILVGDGDETSGSILSSKMAKIAKELNIRIYTIGVGYSDEVPYYSSAIGDTIMVANAFRDDLFKEISKLSSGKYYWVGKNDDPKTILKDLTQLHREP